MSAAARTLAIERLGHRGDGVAPGPVYVPYALPGETAEVSVEGERGRLLTLLEASPERIAPVCPLFTRCGGCAVQHLAPEAYRGWKRRLVVEALSMAGVEAPVEEVVDAHDGGRRRITLHARQGRLGFTEARSHAIVDLDTCPILVPPLNAALPAARALAQALRRLDKPLDLSLTATRTGIDCDLRGSGRLDEALRLHLVALAGELDLARLSNHGEILVERRAPIVRFGRADVVPPAGGFLQATVAADRALAALAASGVRGARRVADLFAGCGTLALVLADNAGVAAFDSHAPGLDALTAAASRTSGLKPVAGTVRDLMRRPLLPEELAAFDAVVFDPPRAGGEAQARRLAASRVPKVVGVSCNPATFARDAAILVAGGYRLTRVTPVDQFRHSPHVEIVGVFER